MYNASEFTFAAPTSVNVYVGFPGNARDTEGHSDKEPDIGSCFVSDVFSCCTLLSENITMYSVAILRRWTLGKRFCISFCRNISLSHVREKKRWEKSYVSLMARKLKIDGPPPPKQR